MPTNASIRVAELVKDMLSGLGTNQGLDTLYKWLEEEYRHIREQAWTWNWTSFQTLTLSGLSEAGNNVFTWTEGDSFITVSTALTLSYRVTGRVVLLGTEWYTVVDYGLASALRVYVDRPIRGDLATGTNLTFYRNDFCIPANKLRAVYLNQMKLMRISQDYLANRFLWNRIMVAGSPYEYTDKNGQEIVAPLYPPVATEAGAGTFENGRYVYFYTRYDVESGLESAPGPSVAIDIVASHPPTVIYGNPVGDKSEFSTYALRLYRTLKNPPRERVPMFLIQERDPKIPGAPFSDTTLDLSLKGKPRYYDGARTIIALFPVADNTRRSLVVEHVRCWGGRPYDEEYLDLGRDNAVMELLRIFLKGVLDLKGGDATSQRTASVVFRSQLAYLITRSRDAGEGDAAPDTYYPAIAGDEKAKSGDWVDFLPDGLK